ncbi:glycosyltransferase [Chloracidobacterium validum]|uniref:Glycosyltransferase n=1 Tax=Chloracidobacterium validum TaxID=2821543 RepID=A0ABX8BAV1_9BACT|nr:glycosyltransferase family 2 protein [Chloracidobacterium validum]QUW04057.1 glycosyltransferase [Chloracidobacterium validum]
MSFRPYWLVLGVVVGVIGWSLVGLILGQPQTLVWLTLGYLSYEVGLTLFLFVATGLGIAAWKRCYRLPRAGLARPVSVLIAAHNEADCILETLASVFGQVGVIPHCIVASDGSTDGMPDLLIQTFGLVAVDGPGRWQGDIPRADAPPGRLTLLALPKVGKGPALNAGLQAAAAPVLVTLDADTLLAPNALLELVAAFEDDRTVAAGGFIYVRGAEQGNWMVRHQYLEFFRNFMWRIGLAHCGVCLQVSGAFGAFRLAALRDVGGFSEDTLVEDYEIIYRMHESFRNRGLPYAIRMVPTAVAYTDSPRAPFAFIKQRTRWFAGFLNTLWAYRRMIGAPTHRAVGLVMLPIKTVDALLPIWGVASLLILIGAFWFGREQWRWYAVTLFGAKLSYDLVLTALMVRLYRRTFPERPLALGSRRLALTVLAEAFGFHWFRQVAVLNAYRWFAFGIRRWEQARWQRSLGKLSRALPAEERVP